MKQKKSILRRQIWFVGLYYFIMGMVIASGAPIWVDALFVIGSIVIAILWHLCLDVVNPVPISAFEKMKEDVEHNRQLINELKED